MKQRLSRNQIRELAKFKPGDRICHRGESGIVGLPFSKQGGIWYSVIFPRIGQDGRYYDAVEHYQEEQLEAIRD